MYTHEHTKLIQTNKLNSINDDAALDPEIFNEFSSSVYWVILIFYNCLLFFLHIIKKTLCTRVLCMDKTDFSFLDTFICIFTAPLKKNLFFRIVFLLFFLPLYFGVNCSSVRFFLLYTYFISWFVCFLFLRCFYVVQIGADSDYVTKGFNSSTILTMGFNVHTYIHTHAHSQP